jgi:hypothetical protein
MDAWGWIPDHTRMAGHYPWIDQEAFDVTDFAK